MNQKINKIALTGKTNSGKSTLINLLVGETISIVNKKINTTEELTIGVLNKSNIQIIIYDTPGLNFLKTQKTNKKKFNINLWQALDSANLIFYLIDSSKYNFDDTKKDILKISETNKKIIIIFNKIDLIKTNKILPYINQLRKTNLVYDFFLISSKLNKGLKELLNFLLSESYNSKWIYLSDEITDKDDIYISNECTRNAILKYLHKEIPYNLKVSNIVFKYLKNNNLKIKKLIEIKNSRYKPIILGKNGLTIKRIREQSQKDLNKIFKCKVHLYLQVNFKNEK